MESCFSNDKCQSKELDKNVAAMSRVEDTSLALPQTTSDHKCNDTLSPIDFEQEMANLLAQQNTELKRQLLSQRTDYEVEQELCKAKDLVVATQYELSEIELEVQFLLAFQVAVLSAMCVDEEVDFADTVLRDMESEHSRQFESLENRYTQDLSKARSDLSRMTKLNEAAVDRIHRQAESRQRALEESQEESSRVRSENLKLRNNQEILEHDLELLREEISFQNDQFAILKEQMEEEHRNDLTKKHESFETQVQKCRDLEECNLMLRRSLEANQKQLLEVDQECNEWRESDHHLEAELEAMQKKLKEAMDDKGKALKKNQQLESLVQSLELNKKEILNRVQKQEKRLQESDKTLSAMSAACSKAATEYTVINQEANMLREDLASMKKVLQVSERKHEEQVKVQQELTERNNSLRESCQCVSQGLEEVENICSTLQTVVDAGSSKVQQLVTENCRLNQQRTSLEGQVEENARKEIKREAKTEHLLKVQQEHFEREIQLEQRLEEYKEMFSKQTTEIAEARAVAERYMCELAISTARYRNLESEFKKLELTLAQRTEEDTDSEFSSHPACSSEQVVRTPLSRRSDFTASSLSPQSASKSKQNIGKENERFQGSSAQQKLFRGKWIES